MLFQEASSKFQLVQWRDFEETGLVMQLKHITLHGNYNKVSQYKRDQMFKTKIINNSAGLPERKQKKEAKHEERLLYNNKKQQNKKQNKKKGNQDHSFQLSN